MRGMRVRVGGVVKHTLTSVAMEIHVVKLML